MHCKWVGCCGVMRSTTVTPRFLPGLRSVVAHRLDTLDWCPAHAYPRPLSASHRVHRLSPFAPLRPAASQVSDHDYRANKVPAPLTGPATAAHAHSFVGCHLAKCLHWPPPNQKKILGP